MNKPIDRQAETDPSKMTDNELLQKANENEGLETGIFGCEVVYFHEWKRRHFFSKAERIDDSH
jgi:hypothetical protein